MKRHFFTLCKIPDRKLNFAATAVNSRTAPEDMPERGDRAMRGYTKRIAERRQCSAWMGWVAFYCVLVMIHSYTH